MLSHRPGYRHPGKPGNVHSFHDSDPSAGERAIAPAAGRQQRGGECEGHHGQFLPRGSVRSMLPIALLIGVLFYMGRQSQRGQQSMFGFGGSKARLYAEEKPSITFADVAGEIEAKQELTEVVDFLKHPANITPWGAFATGGAAGRSTGYRQDPAGAGRGRGSEVPFFNISGSEFVEMFVGVGASRVRDLFTKAKAAAPSIVFVDELDAVGRQRGAGWEEATTSESRR